MKDDDALEKAGRYNHLFLKAVTNLIMYNFKAEPLDISM